MQEYFWSVSIDDKLIQAAIWMIKDQAAIVIATSSSLTYEDDESLITSADEALSNCISNLPEEVAEPTKTVFGVPSFWVSEGQIQKQYLEKIKLICNKLSLTPTGFVVLPEAISYFEKAKDKTPVSAILIGIYDTSIDVSLFKLGNMVGSVNVARSSNIIDDTVEGLARFGGVDMLPSKFILYDGDSGKLDDVKQEFIQADWNTIAEQVRFLHTPQAEILTNEEKMAAVSLAGGVEIGNLSEVKYEKKDDSQQTDILADNYKAPEFSNTDNIEGIVEASELGFNSFDQPQTFAHEEVKQTHQTNINFPGVSSFKPKIGLPKFKLPVNARFLQKNLLFIGAILLLLIIVGGFYMVWFMPKVQVEVIIEPQKMEAKQQIKFDTGAQAVDLNKFIVPAKQVSTTSSGSKTKTTTGSKTIGTPSKGTVTFYNVGDAVTIPAGTGLTGSSLNFSLDKDLQVASASGAASAATAQGTISSSGVGADYNLASGTFFSVEGFSNSVLQAKNDADLTGGSSQEVAATSQSDADTLIRDLTKELSDKATNDLKSKLTGDSLFIDNSLTATPSSKSFDNPVGEEGTTVKLTETIKASGLTFARDDMNKIAHKLFDSKVNQGFALKDDQIDFVTSDKQIDFMANLLPSIDPTKVAAQIAGKNLNDAKAILAKLPGYQDVVITRKPTFLNLPFLPHVANNISVTLSAK